MQGPRVGRRAGSGEAGSDGEKCRADGAQGVLDRRPAGAICFAVACGKNREDAASAASVRDAEGVWVVEVRRPGYSGHGQERFRAKLVRGDVKRAIRRW